MVFHARRPNLVNSSGMRSYISRHIYRRSAAFSFDLVVCALFLSLCRRRLRSQRSCLTRDHNVVVSVLYSILIKVGNTTEPVYHHTKQYTSETQTQASGSIRPFHGWSKWKRTRASVLSASLEASQRCHIPKPFVDGGLPTHTHRQSGQKGHPVAQ